MNLVFLPLRTILRMIRDLDSILTHVVSLPFPSPYKLKGKCLQRGVCCTKIAVGFTPFLWRNRILRGIARRYYEFVYNFDCHTEDDEYRVLLFKCRYLKENKCSIHWRRPYICRRYPKPVKYFFQPELLPGCGYRWAINKKDEHEELGGSPI